MSMNAPKQASLPTNSEELLCMAFFALSRADCSHQIQRDIRDHLSAMGVSLTRSTDPKTRAKVNASISEHMEALEHRLGLEAQADLARTVRELAQLKESNEALQRMYRRQADKLEAISALLNKAIDGDHARVCREISELMVLRSMR